MALLNSAILIRGSAHSKTPWIFAFITTGLLVAIWGGIFIAWVYKRASNAHRRRHGKPPRAEKKPVEPSPAPTYVVPPDPALMVSSERVDGLDQEKARGADTMMPMVAETCCGVLYDQKGGEDISLRIGFQVNARRKGERGPCNPDSIVQEERQEQSHHIVNLRNVQLR